VLSSTPVPPTAADAENREIFSLVAEKVGRPTPDVKAQRSELRRCNSSDTLSHTAHRLSARARTLRNTATQTECTCAHAAQHCYSD
jgi:hypothetical protein